MARPRLILFSGMGVDDRLFDPQRAIDADIIVPPWISAEPGKTLASYSHRLFKTIDTSQPFFLGGVSLGGMIAQEIAPDAGPNLRGLILLVTCQSNRDLFWLLRVGGRFVSLFPARLLYWARIALPLFRKLFGITTSEQTRFYQVMLRDADPHVLKWSIRAVVNWPGRRERANVPTLTIAAEKDLIVPPRLGTFDYVIAGAGHTMNVTHAAEVNRIIGEWLNRQTEAPQQDSHASEAPAILRESTSTLGDFRDDQ